MEKIESNNFKSPEVPKDSQEFLEQVEHAARARKPENSALSENGVESDTRDLHRSIRTQNEITAAEIPQELDSQQKTRVLNELLKPTDDEISHPTLEPYDEIENILKKAIPGE
ncbi:MAG TPA: hypothetical protein VFX17_01300 [Patescibacteria group bacterium]|nr:hypothetical protein [Patescibacteria group bacterium]